MSTGLIVGIAIVVILVGAAVALAIRAGGYEPQNYRQRVADLSVEHSGTLDHYRAAHDISARAAASADELRQAVVHYRTLFEDLLGDGVPTPRPSIRSATAS